RLRGGLLIKVPPQYTSQTCAACGHVSRNNRKSQALFVCERCGHTADADLNAARNIIRAGRAGKATASGSLRSCHREPARERLKNRFAGIP
ncbi:MAG TPA: transposase, partial [Candidatus Avisuccinivibrio pullicola]|nr:transposase [Candidatus Avisuccinivibrio pullicola]